VTELSILTPTEVIENAALYCRIVGRITSSEEKVVFEFSGEGYKEYIFFCVVSHFCLLNYLSN